jgi:hypothetical protein
MGGADVIEENLLANCVRESGDHGVPPPLVQRGVHRGVALSLTQSRTHPRQHQVRTTLGYVPSTENTAGLFGDVRTDVACARAAIVTPPTTRTAGSDPVHHDTRDRQAERDPGVAAHSAQLYRVALSVLAQAPSTTAHADRHRASTVVVRVRDSPCMPPPRVQIRVRRPSTPTTAARPSPSPPSTLVQVHRTRSARHWSHSPTFHYAPLQVL